MTSVRCSVVSDSHQCPSIDSAFSRQFSEYAATWKATELGHAPLGTNAVVQCTNATAHALCVEREGALGKFGEWEFTGVEACANGEEWIELGVLVDLAIVDSNVVRKGCVKI